MVAAMILWAIFALITAMEYAPYCKDLPFSKQMIVMIICLAGPIFAVNNILSAILDMILPEGWDDDDFKGL
jgi:4-hydroxybenzoate polyprenyltransferase